MKTKILSFTMGCLCISGAWAQITLVEGVNPTITFDTLPTMAQGWSTIPMAGAAGNLTTQAQMDTYVNTVSAANAVALVAAAANPPLATGNGGYDPATQRLYTRPTGVNAASLLARVVNTVGADLNRLTIAFDLLKPITAAEEIPPYAVYYSFTGAANSWTLVPQLGGSTLGTHSFELNFPSAWTAGATLYILWVDDNASPSPDALFEIDNVVFTVPSLGVVVQNLATNPGFETGDTTGWFPFGPTAISAQTSQVHSGSYAALVTNRSATWMGIAQDMQGVLWPNLPYVISAWVRLAGGTNQIVELVMKRTDDSGTTYTPIASSSVSANGWTRISGLYTLHQSGGLAKMEFYAQMPSSPDAAYYLDDVEIKELLPPVLPPLFEENTNTASGPHFIFSSTLNVGNQPIAVVAADLNGDGRPELISANYTEHSLTVLARGPNGLFTNSATVAVEGDTGPGSIAVGDVNGDGKLDVVTSIDFSHQLTVLTNSGDGTLILATNVSPGTRPLSVKVADVNGDGRLDLISANHGDGTLTVLTNDGLGGFSLAVTLMARGPFVVADFNGDGAQDLIATGSAFVGLTLFTNDGRGVLAESSPLLLPSQLPLGYLAAADLNGDGKPDVITVEDSGTSAGGSLTIMTNNGMGTFTLAGSPSGHWGPASMAIADLNEDGWQDLVGFDGGGLKVLLNNGKGGFHLSAVVSVTYSPVSVVAADVVGDAKPDLIFVNSGANSLTILRSVPPSPATTPHSYVFSIGAGLSPSLRGPRGVAVDGTGNIYVSDTGNNRIVKFSNTGQVLTSWGNAGSGTGKFSEPLGIAIDSRDNVFVADAGNGRIQKFNSNGVYLTQWAISSPSAVTIDRADLVYVSSGGAWKFTSDGTFLQLIPVNPIPLPYYADSYSSAGLAVARSGDIFLAFAFSGQIPDCCFGGRVSGAGIEQLTWNGVYVNAWGGFANRAPDGLTVDASGFLYVANRLNKQILKYTSEGIPLTQWDLPGGTADPISDPRGVAVDDRGDVVYVADSGNNRILVFAQQPSLSIRGTGANGAVLSWSAAANGFRLQSTLNLNPPVTWLDVTNPPAVNGGHFTVTNIPSGGAQFFRLRRP